MRDFAIGEQVSYNNIFATIEGYEENKIVRTYNSTARRYEDSRANVYIIKRFNPNYWAGNEITDVGTDTFISIPQGNTGFYITYKVGNLSYADRQRGIDLREIETKKVIRKCKSGFYSVRKDDGSIRHVFPKNIINAKRDSTMKTFMKLYKMFKP